MMTELETTLTDFIHFEKLRSVLRKLCASVKIGCCIVAPDGRILLEEGWNCPCFSSPDVLKSTNERRCIDTERFFTGKMKTGIKNHIFTCRNGFSNVGAPIEIDGLHIASIFIGPFTQKPIKSELFSTLPRAEQKRNVNIPTCLPIFSPEKIQHTIDHLDIFVELIAEMGRNQLLEKRTGLALLESEQRYKTLFDKSHDALLLIEDEYIVDCNIKATGFFQISKNDLVGIPFSLLAQSFTALKDDFTAKDLIAILSDKELATEHREWTFFLSDGVKVETEVILNRIDLPDRNIIQMMFHDITLQNQNIRRLEARESIWQALFQHAPFGIAVNRLADGVFLDVNPAMVKATGKNISEILGKSSYASLPQSQHSSSNEVVKVLHEKGFVGLQETEVLKPDGSTRNVLYSAATFESNNEVNVVSMVVDITERKEIEKKLQLSEAKLQSLYHAVPIGLAIVKDRVLLAANECLAEMTGYSVDTLLYNSGRCLYYSDEDFEAVGLSLYQNPDIHGRSHVETKFRHKDGTTRDISMFAAPLDPGNPKKGAAVAIQDITVQKGVNQALQESELRYRSLFEGAGDAILILKDGVFVDCNKKTLDIIQCTREEIIGKSPVDISPPQQPDGQSSTEKIQQLLIAAVQGENLHFEWEICRPAGTTFFSEVSLRSIEMSGESYIQAIVRDITERKKSEKFLRESEFRFRSFFNTNPEGILLLDFQGHILDANKAFLRQSGYTLTECRMSSFKEFVSENDQRKIDQSLFEFRSGIALDEPLQASYRAKDGRVIPVSFKGWLVVDEESTPVYLGVFISDLTKEKALVEDKTTLEKQVIRAQKSEAIGTLASGIAHDFNNILGGIIGYTELALYRDPTAIDHRTKGYLERVLEGSNRAKNLVQQILRFSRNADTVMEPINLTPLIKETLLLLQSTLPKTISFEQSITANPDKILGDSTQIHQVIMNLATNAYHAMRECGGVLTLNICNVTLHSAKQFMSMTIPPGEYIQITVADTGCGMTPSVVERIFEPYYTTKRVNEGTGLGMAVVSGIVKSHRGLIDIQTTPGKGTVFDLYFPTFQGEVIVKGFLDPNLPMGNCEKILIVDDESYFLEVVHDSLKMLGYSVQSHQHSLEALKAFNDNPHDYDLIITDQTMPEMTGVQFIQEVRKVDKTLPIILCTGFSEVVTEQSASYYGINHFLMKPVNVHELARVVSEILSQPD